MSAVKWQRIKIDHGKHYSRDGYRSPDGRWTIVKTHKAASRNGYWKVAWDLYDGEAKVLALAETMCDCKLEVEAYLDAEKLK